MSTLCDTFQFETICSWCVASISLCHIFYIFLEILNCAKLEIFQLHFLATYIYIYIHSIVRPSVRPTNRPSMLKLVSIRLQRRLKNACKEFNIEPSSPTCTFQSDWICSFVLAFFFLFNIFFLVSWFWRKQHKKLEEKWDETKSSKCWHFHRIVKFYVTQS